MSMSKTQRSCHFCDSKHGVYTCPRCGKYYCSSECFRSKSHEQCSEPFFKEWIISTLKDQKTTTDDKRKMLEMLKRSADDDGEDDTNICERFDGLNVKDMDEACIWERLTEQEQNDFKSILQNQSELAGIIPARDPWWMITKVRLVKDNCEPCTERPPLPIGIKSLTSLTSKPPADCLQYNIISVLYCYALLMRFYNNDVRDFLEEAIDCALQLCPVLSQNRNYLTLEEMVQDCINLACSTNLKVSLHVAKSIFRDVNLIITGPENANPHTYILCSLNDLKSLMVELKALWKSEHVKANKKILVNVIRKLDYFQCWVLEYHEKLKFLADELELRLLPELIEDSYISDIQHMEESVVKSRKPLIEEIN